MEMSKGLHGIKMQFPWLGQARNFSGKVVDIHGKFVKAICRKLYIECCVGILVEILS